MVWEEKEGEDSVVHHHAEGGHFIQKIAAMSVENGVIMPVTATVTGAAVEEDAGICA